MITYDELIDGFEELLVKQQFKDIVKGEKTYIKKEQVYKDLVKKLKELRDKNIEIKNDIEIID